MTTGARELTPELAQRAADAGMRATSVSIDGLEATHDRLRAVPGSWKAAVRALGAIRDAGMQAYANTQWNKLNLPEVEDLAAVLRMQGVSAWQVQVTGPMGRASDREDWLLQPPDLLDLVPRLAAIAREGRDEGFRVEASNNLGYFGPFEQDLRRAHWQGCQAGRYVLGIESNGDVKGCPSLPSAPYVGGNLRDRPLKEIWDQTAELRFSRDRTPDELWGFCKSCYYAETCRGGCSWTSHTLLGRRGNLPLCYHRADTLREQGVRERLVKVEAAPGAPFDFGRYEVVEEPWA
jgi:radical SAM protein with 4Fe4S-binding SPASM domain